MQVNQKNEIQKHTENDRIYRLQCMVKDYAWGVLSDDSWIKSCGHNKHVLDPQKPAAELWMGVHPSGPSRISDTGILLSKKIESDKEKTPDFLFKVLEAQSALSIQAHPDKILAEQLHLNNPENYPDDNHKPEMVVCLKDLEVLAGFRTPDEMKVFHLERPLTSQAIFKTTNHRLQIRDMFSSLMNLEGADIAAAVQLMHDELQDSQNNSFETEDILFHKLIEQYGSQDPGIFCVYIMNYLRLSPGEALYLGANEPHAYIRGRMIEVMASSDNVVRAGLTSKFRDVKTLLNMLTYKIGTPEILKAEGEPLGHYPVIAPEFRLSRGRGDGNESVKINNITYPAILVIIQGEGKIKISDNYTHYEQGDVFYLPERLMNLDIPSVEIERETIFFLASSGET